MRVPRPAQFGIWLRKRTRLAGVVWGVVLAVLFFFPEVIIQLGVTNQTTATDLIYLGIVETPILLAFLFGYWLRDVEDSIKALVISQFVEWVLILTGLFAFSSAFQAFFFSSNPPQRVGLGIGFLSGLAILSFFLGLLFCALGAVVGSHLASRRGE